MSSGVTIVLGFALGFLFGVCYHHKRVLVVAADRDRLPPGRASTET
jgi:hypothetical protein